MIRHRILGTYATRVTKRKIRTYVYHIFSKGYLSNYSNSVKLAHFGLPGSNGEQDAIPESGHLFATNSLSLSVIAQIRLSSNLLLQGSREFRGTTRQCSLAHAV